jgi:uncharacterized protein YjbI with pentapeptide repeats
LTNTSFHKADIRNNRFTSFDISTTNFSGAKVDLDLAITAVNMLGAIIG